jgi:chemotaxis protein MotA
MDPLFFAGFIVTLLAIGISTIMDGNSFGPLIGPSSFVMVLFGALGAGLQGYRIADILILPKAVTYALTGKPPDPSAAVTTLAGLADVARRDGMLALEGRLEEVDDTFLRRGLQLVVDGLDGDQVREVLDIDIAAMEERHRMPIGFLRAVGGYCPTFGMVGTVIGLVNMLGNLTDPAQLGIGMALALLTTLYGVVFANMIFMPMAARLERMHKLEMAALDLALDGILSIQSGTSPRLLVERLEIYLPPSARIGLAERTGAAKDAA